MHLINRTCTEISESAWSDQIHNRSQPLSAYKQSAAYVLLGDPGAGKTTLFKQEAERQDACYVTARDLITFEDRHEWHEKTLFIDGLDEIRAGVRDARTPFDAIRSSLHRLGRPGFRLSCREADWFGASDKEHLKSVSPDGQVAILRIDPLTDADILEILNHNSRVADAAGFVCHAKQRDLDDLLKNPQILDMLAKAIADGSWPDTRKQTFEMACQTIIREHNQEHIDATRKHPIDENQQLSAAGLLCAVQLITGNAGYALSSTVASRDFPELNNSAFDNVALLEEVIATKLFKSDSGNERRIPIHRHVAEYLAARHLTERIDDSGLSVSRILALITGEDGVVVAELRGLSAWLAALCKSQRSAIIDCDPLGVVLYGDVSDFTRQDKRRVLDALQREAARYPWFRSSNWAASPFGALASPDMEPEFRKILTSPDRSDAHQAFADCVLDAMTHGARLPTLDDTLLDIIRNSDWWPGVRRQALIVVQRDSESTSASHSRLKKLLVEINSETVIDLDDDLMGNLLSKLYPRAIPATKVLDYLHAPKRQSYLGHYWKFWRQHLLGQSSNSDICILLDELVVRRDTLLPVLNDIHFRDLGVALLSRGLDVYGESIEPVRLHGWLGVGLDRHGWPNSTGQAHGDSIRSWLQAHPAVQKAIVSIGLDRCVANDNFERCMRKDRGRLYVAELPTDYGRWCLEKMRTTINDKIARYLLQEAVDALCYQRGNADLSLDTIKEIAKRKPKHNSWLKDMLVRPIEPDLQEHNRQNEQYKEEQREKKQQWLRYVKSQETELREGRANHSLLHDMATAYFGNFIDSDGDTPTERLRNYLVHDEALVQAAFEGLRHSLKRDDIPEVEDIIQSYTEGRTYYLCRPILAGLDELSQSTPHATCGLNDQQLRKAVAFYLVDGMGEDPNWYRTLLELRPDLVADVITAYVIAALRTKKQHITGLYALAYVDEYDRVARLASLTMLKAFPVRGTKRQLASLDELLIAAFRHAEKPELLALIDNKLGLRSLNAAQRVRWLAAGLLVAPEKYLERLTDFTQGNETRVRHLAGFLAERYEEWFPIDELPTNVLGFLVRLFGTFFAPYKEDDSHGLIAVSDTMNAANLVDRLINRLGQRVEEEATNLLDSLSADASLDRWQAALKRAHFEQSAARREAGFRHPDIRQACETLKNRSPANPGDLAALTVDVLRDLANQIRNGNTDDYLQFWNEGPHRHAETPKYEEACRNALLSDLQQRLAPHEVDAQAEAHYADNKRADIRVAFGGADGFQVPIEVKKNSSPDLWRGIHQQLIAKYTRDPLAHGFGIYLVFWFGSAMTQPPASGPLPRTADDLEKRLQSTLSADENRKISVLVIDVAKPG